ncbi:MAG: hypothetical protein JKY01_14085 [Pseudomonadales bacterium]|nr:hypothetical protein [Pseudomonadales bacterium]
MSNFLNDNFNQSGFFDINYPEVLGEDTFEHLIYKLFNLRIIVFLLI